MHQEEITPQSVCVDEKKGIFMVRKSMNGGVAFPIHVRKMNSNGVGCDETNIFCENEPCRTYMNVAWRSGMPAAECHHLRNVATHSVYQKELNLNEDDLRDLSNNGSYKILKDERINDALDLRDNAGDSPLIVAFEDGERYIHFSVVDRKVNFHSKLKRVIVSCDIINGTLDCRCCRRKRSCVHKAVCLWYLRGEGRLDAFRGSFTTNEAETKEIGEHSFETNEEIATESPAAVNGPEVYPPADVNVIKGMVNYLQRNKHIPLETANTCSSVKRIPDKFVPTEKTCWECKAELGKPILITRNASVLTCKEFVTNVSTYFVKCSDCGMCYRYQEHCKGIHNFNDLFLIGIDVCLFFRESLQQHIPVGSLVKILEQQLKATLKTQTIFNAYLHFEAMTDHNYQFNCAVCGYHPVTLIMDLNRKVCFKSPVSDLQLPEEYDEDEADYVDCFEFWNKVNASIIMRGLSKNMSDSQSDVEPNLQWSPFIGPKSRKGPMLINTEHRKVQREDGEIESDCREVT